MASLGGMNKTISVNVNLNTANFTAGLKRVASQIQALQKSMIVVDKQGEKGGTYRRYGLFKQSFFKNIDMAISKLKVLEGQLSRINKQTGGMARGFGGQAAAAMGSGKGEEIGGMVVSDVKEGNKLIAEWNKNNAEVIGKGNEAAYTMKRVAGGFQIVGGQIRSVTAGLKGFIAHLGRMIWHYITFTIGVQLVMKFVQAIQQAIDIFKKFESSVVNAASVTGYLGKSFETAKESIRDLSIELAQKTIYTATQTAEAMYTIASAGIDPVKSSMEELLPIFNYAAATQTDLADATQYLLTVMKQFRFELEDLGMVTDVFTTMITNSFMTAEKMADAFQYVGQVAGELNQDVTEVAAALTVLADRGYTGAQAGQRLNMIFNKLIKPTDKAVMMLTEMGISLTDIDPSAHRLTEILHKLKDAEFDVGNASQMFRARTAAAAATLVSSVDAVDELANSTKALGGITESIAKRQMETLESKFKQFQGTVEEVSIGLGETIGKVFVNLGRSASNLAENLGKLAEGADIDTSWVDDLLYWAKGITILGALSIWSDFAENLNDMQDDINAWNETQRGFLSEDDDTGLNILQEFDNEVESAPGAIQEYAKSITDLGDAFEAIRNLDPESDTYQEDFIRLSGELYLARQNLMEGSDDFTGASSKIIAQMMEFPGPIADTINAYQSWAAATSDVTQLSLERDSLLEEEIDLIADLNRIENNRGKDSAEWISTNHRYLAVTSRLAEIREEMPELIEAETSAMDDYNEQFDDLGAKSQRYVSIARDLIDMRKAAFDAETDWLNQLNEYNRMVDAATNYQKNYHAAQLEVFELEDKRYKLLLKQYELTENQKDLDQEMFDHLAEQGLLTDDIIESYKEWQEAEGELAWARAAFARGEITEEQLQEYINRASQEQMEYNHLLVGSGEEVAGIVGKYMELGIASNDVVATAYKMKDALNDDAQITAELVGLESDLLDAKEAVANVPFYTAEQIQDAWDKAEELEQIFLQKVNDLKNIDIKITAQVEFNTREAEPAGRKAGDDFSTGFGENANKGLEGFIADFLKSWADMLKGIGSAWDWLWGNIGAGGRDPGTPPPTRMRGMQHGGMTSGPEVAMIGEAGPEAVIPLSGSNKKYGESLLRRIIPHYFPNLRFMQQGGTAGGVYFGARGGHTAEMVKVTGAEDIARALAEMPRASDEFKNMVIKGGQLSGDLFVESTTGAGDQWYETLKQAGNEQYATQEELKAMGLETAEKESSIALDTSNQLQVMAWGAGMFFREQTGYAGTNFLSLVTRAAGNFASAGHTHARGGIFSKATMGVFGEAGAEALIPLEGANKKYGAELLRHILPSYYPELMGYQHGGIFGGGSAASNTYNSDSFNVHGPITVVANNPQDFMEQMKYKFRSSSRR